MILTHGANSLPRASYEKFVTIGGRDYPVVKIGNQLWMAESLDYKYDGLEIGEPYVSSELLYGHYFNDDEASYGINGIKWGLLYNFAATKYLNDNRTTLLPDGWHVPSLDEVNTLIASLGDQATAGRELKNASQWSPNSGTDLYGFNALPGGYIDYGGDFRTTSEDYESRGTFTGFWTTDSYSERYSDYIYEFVLFGTSDELAFDYYYWDSSFYIRLVRNL